jgi:hypothetical protein
VTRWWAYAVLAIAIVAGGVRMQASTQTARCELRESANLPASAARKRNGKVAYVSRREANGSNPLAIVPERIEVTAPSRVSTLVTVVVREGRATVATVRACSRAPPRG